MTNATKHTASRDHIVVDMAVDRLRLRH